jgi:lipid-A-disaccharide synthase-like uncharacterized protein
MLPKQATLIDEKGKLWDAASPLLRKSLFLESVEGDVSRALIDNLGFVGVSARHGRVIIRFNPKSASKAAVGALYYWLASHISTRICLTFALRGQDQRYEIFASARAALLRMEALLDCEHRVNWTPLFSARAGVLDSVGNRSPFAALFDYWRATSGLYTESAYLSLLRQFAADRYVVFEPRSAGGFFIVRAGRGLHIPDEPAHRALGGSQLDDISDQDYAVWVSRFYTAAFQNRQPRYDHIRAYINWPRAGRVERKYTRLILPCHARDGRQLLLGISGAFADDRLLAKRA